MENQKPAEDPAIANIVTLKMTDNHMEESISAAQQVNMDKEVIVDSKNDLEIINENINSGLNPGNEKNEDAVLDNDNLLKGESDNALNNVIPFTEDTVREINNANEKKITIANSEDMHVMLEESDNINHENQSFTIKMNILDDVQNEDDEIKQDYLDFEDSVSFEVSNESNFKECPYSCDLDECNLNNGQINHEFLLARGDVPKNMEFFSSNETDYFQNDDKLLSSLALSSPPGSQKPCSPDSPRSYDSTLDENETASSVHKKNFSLPYFWLPNPNLEDFFVETEKKLQVPEIKTSTPGFTRKIFEPKDTGDIVFTIEDGAVKNNSEIFSETSEELPRKMSERKDTSDVVFTIENDSETSRNSSSNDYRNLLKSIDKLDDSRSPGIKRLALKEYLKKKIEEKKLLLFQRSRENAKLDEEMEEGYTENVNSESSTNDDFEEEIVSFGTEPCKSLDEKSNSQELSNDFHHAKNGESDDDDDDDEEEDEEEEKEVCPRKTKKVPILEDDSSDESEIVVGDKCDNDNNVLAVTSCDSKTYGEIENPENYIDENLNMSADLLLGLSKARVFSNCSDVDDFQGFSPLKLNDRNDFHESMEISPSIPSYQLETDFCNEEEFDVNKSEMMQPLKKNWDLKSEKENFLNSINSDLNMELNASIIEDKSPYNSTPNFGLTLDDPPISESENVSDMFQSQDLVNLCSGVFKSDTPHKADFGIDKKEYFDEEPGENCTKMDDLPQEKVQDYFDNEAELSGDDDGLDDDQVDYDDDENELYIADDNELPAEEDLRDEIADLHMKQVRDDDEELLKEIQEKFLDDGELNNDGKGRIRKYAWKNNDIGDTFGKNRESSSESDSEESLDETWSSMSREKAKWRQENEEEDDVSEMCPSYKKPLLKINIIGKSECSKPPECLSNKRPRGSFLHLDDNAASRVLKKLKVSEDTCGGSRSTKHFLFLNDPSEETAVKGASGILASKAVKGASGNLASKAVKGASGNLASKAVKGASDNLASKIGKRASDDLASDNTSGRGSVFNKI